MLATAAVLIACVQPDRSVTLGPFVLGQSAQAAPLDNAIARGVAEERALTKLVELNPDVTGLEIPNGVLSLGLKSVTHSNGNSVFASNKSENAWVFEIKAPPQDGFKKVEGLVIVDALTGEVISAQLLKTND
jgi:hypothetical protein